MWGYNEADLKVLEGQTLSACVLSEDNEEVTFVTEGGETYRLLHIQDCCEHVWVEDVIGDLTDLVGTPIVLAEVVDSSEEPPLGEEQYRERYEWTFYRFRTMKGSVTIRFYGESDYYSLAVDFVKV